MTRRNWEKPSLIVLVKSGPEEYVLEVCKSVHGSGPVNKPIGASGQRCKNKKDETCGACASEGGGTAS